MQNTVSGKQMNISLLRILATLGVVFLHTNSGILDRPDLFVIQDPQKAFLTLGKQFMNWVVPVFFMITGALMLRTGKPLSLRTCITKYAKRILLALFCFGVPFSMMELFLDTRSFSLQTLFDAFIHVLTGNSWAHLWYLYTLLGVYCLLPVFKRFVDTAPRTELKYTLLFLFFFQIIVPLLETVSGLAIAFEIPITANAVLYLLLGKYLSDELPILFRSKKRCALLLGLAFALAALTYFLTRREGLLEYFAPVYAVLIFSLFQGADIPGRISPILWRIDRLCFGVYLVHPVFINFAYKFLKITPISFEAYALMAVLFFLIFSACSFFASIIMSMIPPLKKHIL